MKTADRILMEQLYDEMYQDNLMEEKIGLGKKILGGIGALGLAAGGMQGLANHIVNKDQAQKSHVDPHGAKLENIEISNKFNDPTKVANLIQTYFKSKGKNVSAKFQGDKIVLSGDVNKSIPIKTMKYAVDAVMQGEGSTPLANYLADNL